MIRIFIDPAIVLFTFLLSFLFVIACGLLCGGESVNVFFFLIFVYICIAVGHPIIKMGRLESL